MTGCQQERRRKGEARWEFSDAGDEVLADEGELGRTSGDEEELGGTNGDEEELNGTSREVSSQNSTSLVT